MLSTNVSIFYFCFWIVFSLLDCSKEAQLYKLKEYTGYLTTMWADYVSECNIEFSSFG